MIHPRLGDRRGTVIGGFNAPAPIRPAGDLDDVEHHPPSAGPAHAGVVSQPPGPTPPAHTLPQQTVPHGLTPATPASYPPPAAAHGSVPPVAHGSVPPAAHGSVPPAASEVAGFGQHQAFHAAQAYPGLPAAPRYQMSAAIPEPAPPVRMNKWTYRLVIIGGILLSAALGTWGATERSVSELLAFFWIPIVPALVMQWVLVYKMWSAIQDSHVRMSPAKAVAYLFVPLFNLYWIFEVFPGFATDFNNYVARHRLQVKPLSRGLILAWLLLPGLGVILYWVVIGRICDGVNNLSAQS
jgi:hypothetical protein